MIKGIEATGFTYDDLGYTCESKCTSKAPTWLGALTNQQIMELTTKHKHIKPDEFIVADSLTSSEVESDTDSATFDIKAAVTNMLLTEIKALFETNMMGVDADVPKAVRRRQVVQRNNLLKLRRIACGRLNDLMSKFTHDELDGNRINRYIRDMAMSTGNMDVYHSINLEPTKPIEERHQKVF